MSDFRPIPEESGSLPSGNVIRIGLRDLSRKWTQVEGLLAIGGLVVITRHRRPVAVVLPPPSTLGRLEGLRALAGLAVTGLQ